MMVELKEIIFALVFIFGSESFLFLVLANPTESKAFFKWLAFDFSGLRLIWSKILPPKYLDEKERKPSSFLLWLIGTYVAFFGVASQRYENRIDLIENRANSIFAQLSTPAFKSALSRIPIVQSMDCPVKPEILNPKSIFLSLFGEDEKNPEMVALLKLTIENWKESLEGLDLSGADLEGADLEGANLRGAFLVKANLKGANLDTADLTNAFIRGANVEKASFVKANLIGLNKKLAGEGLELEGGGYKSGKADRLSVKFGELGYQPFDTIRQLSKAATLNGAKIDDLMKSQLQKLKPDLFKSGAPSPPKSFAITESSILKAD